MIPLTICALFAFFLNTIICTGPCTSYICVNQLFAPEPTLCLHRFNESVTFLLSRCRTLFSRTLIARQNQICKVDEFSQSVWCQDTTPSGLKPGDRAQNASQCHSDKMDKMGYCTGKTSGKCESHLDCDTGFYCDKQARSCFKAIEEGHSCASGQMCQSYLTCYQGVCFKYGHLQIGQKVEEGGSADNCQTRYMDDKTRLCETGPKLLSNARTNKVNAMCKYSYKGDTIMRWPTCGYSSNGTLVCPKLEGDLEGSWKDLLKYMDFKPQCHVTHKYGICDKVEMTGCGQYVAGIKAFYEADPSIASTLEDMPGCMKNWMHTQYWYPACKQLSYSDKRLSIGLYSLITFVLLVLL